MVIVIAIVITSKLLIYYNLNLKIGFKFYELKEIQVGLYY